jgi:hypothetical protein
MINWIKKVIKNYKTEKEIKNRRLWYNKVFIERQYQEPEMGVVEFWTNQQLQNIDKEDGTTE